MLRSARAVRPRLLLSRSFACSSVDKSSFISSVSRHAELDKAFEECFTTIENKNNNHPVGRDTNVLFVYDTVAKDRRSLLL